MSGDKILFVDTETGGLDPFKNSLLSVGLVVWQDFKIIDSKEFLINDNMLRVTEKALEINKIDIEEHSKNALKSEEAIKQLDTFLSKHFDREEKIILGGHNINFDVNFLKHFLLENQYDYHKRFSHRNVDTATILYYLYLSGQLKHKTVSSNDAFEYFGIKVDSRHTALGDSVATANLFSILLKIIYKNVRIKNSEDKPIPELFK